MTTDKPVVFGERSVSKLYILLDAYMAEVNASALSDSSKRDYNMFAEMFVRWVDGDFEPGSQANKWWQFSLAKKVEQ